MSNGAGFVFGLSDGLVALPVTLAWDEWHICLYFLIFYVAYWRKQ